MGSSFCAVMPGSEEGITNSSIGGLDNDGDPSSSDPMAVGHEKLLGRRAVALHRVLGSLACRGTLERGGSLHLRPLSSLRFPSSYLESSFGLRGSSYSWSRLLWRR